MQFYAVGDEWPTEQLPEGDSYGVYWQETGGLWLLAAAEQLSSAELSGVSEGHCEIAVGTSGNQLLVFGSKFDGWGWLEAYLGNVPAPGVDLERCAVEAREWRDAPQHGTLTSFLVERTDTQAHIRALRYFTLSKHVTQYIGAQLSRLYDGPQLTRHDYETAARAHQQRYPTSALWVRDGSPVRCRAGD